MRNPRKRRNDDRSIDRKRKRRKMSVWADLPVVQHDRRTCCLRLFPHLRYSMNRNWCCFSSSSCYCWNSTNSRRAVWLNWRRMCLNCCYSVWDSCVNEFCRLGLNRCARWRCWEGFVVARWQTHTHSSTFKYEQRKLKQCVDQKNVGHAGTIESNEWEWEWEGENLKKKNDCIRINRKHANPSRQAIVTLDTWRVLIADDCCCCRCCYFSSTSSDRMKREKPVEDKEQKKKLLASIRCVEYNQPFLLAAKTRGRDR